MPLNIQDKIVEREINKLIQINSSIMNEESQFRKENAFCGTRDYRRVKFVPVNKIQEFLAKTLEKFLGVYVGATNQKEIEFSIAYIWLSLISIHPFKNGNGRTAKTYISEKLKEKGYELKSIAELDNFILEENTNQNLTTLIEIVRRNILKKSVMNIT